MKVVYYIQKWHLRNGIPYYLPYKAAFYTNGLLCEDSNLTRRNFADHAAALRYIERTIRNIPRWIRQRDTIYIIKESHTFMYPCTRFGDWAEKEHIQEWKILQEEQDGDN